MATLYRLSADVLHVEVEAEAVLLDYMSGKYFGLKGAILQVMDQLREGASLDDMVARVVDHYDVSEDAAREDLHQVLTQLRTTGLIEAVGTA